MTKNVGRARPPTRAISAAKAVRASSIISFQWYGLVFLFLWSSPFFICDPFNTKAHKQCPSVVVATPDHSDESAAQGEEKASLARKHGNSSHPNQTLGQILSKAGERALGGGLSGALAGVSVFARCCFLFIPRSRVCISDL